jgi:hypothetical protein
MISYEVAVRRGERADWQPVRPSALPFLNS